jgi:NodT family efflux transporter outer membrane factor (OMF) lipoprotein
LSSGENFFNLHTAQLSVSYAIDVFGTNRRQVEALQAQADLQRFQLEAAHLSLTSNVVATVIQVASLRAQISATESTVQLLDEQRKLFSRQLELGAIPEVNLIAQEATLAQTSATLPPLKKQLAQQQNLLAVLTGRYPSEMASIEFDLADLQLPEELPVSLPSTLVQYRPDVRASEEQLHTASAQVGVAVANMFPQLTLTGGLGSSAPAIAGLFTSGTGFWSVAGSLTQPIFQGGTLFHRKRSAEAVYEQAANQYRSTVLSAFQDVANTLYALRFDAETLAAALAAERLTFRTFEIVRRQVELGDTSYLALLSAEQAYQQARINLTLAQANRFADTAALFQALGGGWWNRAGAVAKN